jgi:hypothetical protein
VVASSLGSSGVYWQRLFPFPKHLVFIHGFIGHDV